MKYKLLFFILLIFVSINLAGQDSGGRIIHETIVSTAIQNNPGGEDALRHVALYLPPGYEGSSGKYPVIFWGHGFGNTPADSIFYKMDSWKNLLDKAIIGQVIKPIIMVFVDNTTEFWGSNYANSILTGNWEDLMSKEMVEYIDSRYRTIKSSKSRGVAGFSMGGYGALRLAMRNPDVFKVVYAHCPAMGALTHNFSIENRRSFKLAAEANSKEELLPDFMARAIIAYGRTFTPNLEKPPFYCDLPIAFDEDGVVFYNDILEIWHNNTLVELIEDNISGLRKLKAIKFDWGMHDIPYITASCRTLTNKLGSYGINHYAEEFNGGHGIPKFTDDGPYLTEMLPFFAEQLVFE